MTTFANLRTYVARDIRDASMVTFDATSIGDMINAGLAVIGRAAPQRFQEDIIVTADTLSYQLRSGVFGLDTPEIELKRVEVWDKTYTPYRFVAKLLPLAAEYDNVSTNGWEVWGGRLIVTNNTADFIDPDRHVLRVTGYSPYLHLSGDSDVCPLSNDLERALRSYCKVEALQRLVLDRDLFTQWQQHSQNTEVTPASLMNTLSVAQASWRAEERHLYVPREGQ